MQSPCRLNQKQKETVIYGEGPVMVIAGPGSGKTHTIVHRILYLIKTIHIPPQQILVITFTKEAALSMQNRFYKESDNAYSTATFGTFHSIFYNILKKSNQNNQGLLSEYEKQEILKQILLRNKSYLLNPNQEEEEIQQLITQLVSVISMYKNTLDVSKVNLLLSKFLTCPFNIFFDEYELERKKTGKIDFDDMLFQSFLLLKNNKDICTYWKNQFQYIIIDEFQDCNKIQFELLKLICKFPFNIMAVGDDDQAIYGFRGSNPDIMNEYMKEFHLNHYITLDINYRSLPEILCLAEKIILHNKNRFMKTNKAVEIESKAVDMKSKSAKMVSNAVEIESKTVDKERYEVKKETKANILIQKFEDKNQQYTYLTNKIEIENRKYNDQQQEQNFKEYTQAVLFRTNMEMQYFGWYLTRANIAFSMKERSNSVYEHFVVQDIICYLQVAYGINERRLFLKIMNKPVRGINRDWITENQIDFIKILEYCDDSNSTNKKNIHREIDKLRNGLNSLKNMSLFLQIQYIRKYLNYDKFLLEKSNGDDTKYEEWIEILEWLTEDVADFSDFQAWYCYMEDMKKKMKKTEEESKHHKNNQWGIQGSIQGNNQECIYRNKLENTQNHLKSAIWLMTLHASKGLEFDKVYIPNVNEGTIPKNNSIEKQLENSLLEEECRLLYVGVTRAKEALELLYLTGTQNHPKLPSRFLI